MDTNTGYLGGKIELAIGNMVIEPQFLTDVSVNISEGTRTTDSMAGKISQPSGMIETAEVTGNMILPSMDALKKIFQHMYQAGESEDLSGRVVFGSGSCESVEPVPVNIHYVCEPNSDNDIHIYAAKVLTQFNPTFNATDNLTVGFTILAQPTALGYAFAGAGDLSQKTLWDAVTQQFRPVTPPSA